MKRAVALVLVALAACSGGGDPAFAPLPEPDDVDLEETTTTTEPDLSAVPMPQVLGTTTTSVVLGPGPLTVVGRVEGPNGIVPDAVVQLERLVGDGVASTRVPTAPDGTWNLANVLGGRFRVRAWRAPDLATARPTIVFLEAGEQPSAVDLRLAPVGGTHVDVAVAPDPPPVDEPVNVKIRVAVRTVDDEGVVRDTPAPSVSVAVSGSGEWQVSSPNPSFTQADGSVTLRMTCLEAGDQRLQATVDGAETFALAIQPCVDDDSPTTTTTTTGSTTSTTA